MTAAPPTSNAYYAATGVESDRLAHGQGLLEKRRTRDLLRRFLPPAPAVVYDVGGAEGVYAFPLAGAGYQVHLFDPVAAHIEEARRTDAAAPHRLARIAEGDARSIAADDRSADAVLLLGPLYHLTAREDRLKALREARRVLRPGGVCMAAAISRYSGWQDGLKSGYWRDPYFVGIADRDLAEGQHRNPRRHPDYFTTAFFHHPDELAAELSGAGFGRVSVRAVEGPVWTYGNLEDILKDADDDSPVMRWLRELEQEPSLLGASSHLMGIGYAAES